MATNTATSSTTHTGNGSTNAFAISFSFLADSEIDVTVGGTLKTLGTHYTISGSTLTFTSGNTPAGSAAIKFQRDTDISTKKVDFSDGSVLTEVDLDNNSDQILFAQQEIIDKLNGIEEGATGDQTNAEIRTAVEAATDSNVFTDADHSKLNAIEASATADQTAAEIRTLVESASDSNVFTDADHTKLNGIEASATADQTNAEIRTAVEAASDSNVFTDADHTKLGNAVTLTDTQTLTNKTLTTPVINDLSGTAVVTSGTSTSDNKIYSAKRAGEIFYGKDTVGEIQSGETWSSADDKVATTAAIDARIIDLVDDVGGFVPIANETSFPTANPDAENGTGTIVSVKAASTNLTPSGTTVTISNGAGTGNTVTITGVPSVIASGFGFLVETTTTLHTYTFHRLTPKATEVTTVAANATQVQTVHTNITNINAVASNATNINAVAADASDIGAVAGKATEIGRLGTADAVADMALLGTTDVVADMNLLAVSDVISDMNALAVSDVIADMNLLAVSDVISDMNDLATSGNITAMSTCSTNISSINNASSNISSVNNFGDKYQVASSDPSTDGGGNALAEGDLYFNTTANELKVYNGGAWQGGVTASGNFASTTGNTFTGNNIYNDVVKALFGTGSDLQIFHDGNHNYIQAHNGNLILQAPNQENSIRCVQNAAVELYYDNSKKFETTSGGASITGDLAFPTTNRLYFGNSDVAWVKGEHGASGYLEFGVNSIQMTINRNGTINIPDNNKFTCGNSDDLQIFHDQLGNRGDAGFNKIESVGSHLDIQCNNNVSITVPSSSNSGADTPIRMAHFQPSNSVELYFNGSKKFETVTGGATITGVCTATSFAGDGSSLSGINTDLVSDTSPQLGGNLDTNTKNILFGDSASSSDDRLKFGAGSDLEIYHGSDSNIIDSTGKNFFILHNSDSAITSLANGAVQLYYDNSKKFETTSDGVTIIGDLFLDNPSTAGRDIKFDVSDNALKISDNVNINFGTGNDLQIFHDGTNSTLQNNTGVFYVKTINGEFSLVGRPNGATELYFDHSKKFETTSAGCTAQGIRVEGTIVAIGSSDSRVILQVPSGNGDDWNYIEFTGENGTRDAFLGTWSDGTPTWSRDDGNTKIQLLNGSASINGAWRPEANNSYDLGTSSLRWRNVYTNDLNLSNEGGSNDVDGTWGSYTIQEGAEDLFLVNKRNGKKYKFNLTEVS